MGKYVLAIVMAAFFFMLLWWVLKAFNKWFLTTKNNLKTGWVRTLSLVGVFLVFLLVVVPMLTLGTMSEEISLPSLGGSSYLATYNDGKVVKRPYGSVKYLHGKSFRVPLKAMPCEVKIGHAVLSWSPRLTFPTVRPFFIITDLDLFYSNPDVRAEGFAAHRNWLDKFVTAEQVEVFGVMNDSGLIDSRKGDCESYEFYKKLIAEVNKETSSLGFKVEFLVPHGINGFCKD